MKRLSGFSLMEMMVVLLITAVVAAVTAPMISRKMISSAGGDSPWMWSGLQNSIVYNVEGKFTKTANIGGIIKDKDPLTDNDLGSRLYIETGNKLVPHITFKSKNASANTGALLHLIFDKSSVLLTNIIPDSSKLKYHSTVIGVNAESTDDGAIAIGSSTDTDDKVTAAKKAIAIGYSTKAEGEQSTVIGSGAVSNSKNTVAIGAASNASGENATAIGASTKAGANSLALGAGANATGADALAIGYGAEAPSIGAVAVTTGGTAYGAKGANSTAFGHMAIASKEKSVSIGNDAKSDYWGTSVGGSANSSMYAVALGTSSNATSMYSTAVGSGASATGGYATAIGYNTQAPYHGSVAIGPGARTSATGQIVINSDTVYGTSEIVLGNKTSKVKIPGTIEIDNLVVKNSVSLAENSSANHGVYIWGRQLQWKTVGIIAGIVTGTECLILDSDKRLKNVGEVFKGGLAEIKKLEVFNFTYKKDPNKTPMVGVMAQDLQKIFPNAVFKSEDGFLRIRLEDMFYAMVNAIKELDLKISGHDKKIEQLQKQNEELQKKLDKLEQRIDKLEKKSK